MAQAAKTASALPHGLGRRCLTTCFSCSRSSNNTSSSSTTSAAQPAATGACGGGGGGSPHSSCIASNKPPAPSSSAAAEMMTGRLRVRLHGGAPWGFRLFGGDDLPLLIAKVSLFYDCLNNLFSFQFFTNVYTRICVLHA